MEKFVLEGEAIQTKDGEVGVWTDGVGMYSDGMEFCDFKFEPGEKYRITVEKL